MIEVLGYTFAVVLLIPVVAYFTVKAGTMGFLRAKSKFESFKKNRS